LFGLALLYYWKRNITKTYIDCLRENNITDLNQQIYNLNQRMAELEADNVRMAKIIHRDNKLIPAMEYAVTRYLSESGETTADKKRQGRSLLAELKEMSADRKNIITQSQSPELLLVKTDIEEIDRLLAFQCQQAADNHIQLQVMCSCNLKPLPQSGIEISDLKTVMADLIENAMIATKANHASSVLVSFSMLKNSYAITIFDSGNPFATEVLLNLGKKQITTHEDGSGIGLMNSFQLLDKYNASFIITEFEDSHTQYTKSVSIIFNGEHRYILKPKRSEEEIRMLQERKDLLIWI
ncbi:MAG: GHKL domain-containing protein, partial [Lachnospiraceae bacterium]|nr:GHKL domain-containing protein [Lachnospiraceae bacterium]